MTMSAHATAATATTTTNDALSTEAARLSKLFCQERVFNLTEALLADLRTTIQRTHGIATGVVLPFPLNATTCGEKMDVLGIVAHTLCDSTYGHELVVRCDPPAWDRRTPTAELFTVEVSLRAAAAAATSCNCTLKAPTRDLTPS
jgi:hypothetical protein